MHLVSYNHSAVVLLTPARSFLVLSGTGMRWRWIHYFSDCGCLQELPLHWSVISSLPFLTYFFTRRQWRLSLLRSLAQFPPRQRSGGGSPPAGSRGTAPEKQWKFVTVSFNFHAVCKLLFWMWTYELLYSCLSFCQMLIDFQNFSTLLKFATNSSLHIPPYLNRVAIHYRMKY